MSYTWLGRTKLNDTIRIEFPSPDFAQVQEVTVTVGDRSQRMQLSRKQLVEWEQGAVIQRALPQLSLDQREFLLTGLTNEEWDKMVGEDK